MRNIKFIFIKTIEGGYITLNNDETQISTDMQTALIISENITNQAFKKIVEFIDAQYGNDYAKRNPGLVSALLEFHKSTYVYLLNLSK